MDKTQLLYLALALIIWLLGYLHTGRLVRPKWKLPGKFLFYMGVSAILLYYFRHYALVFILLHPAIGLFFHTKICKEHQINWWSCQPEEKYLALQEKWARGEFGKEEKQEKDKLP